MRVQEPSIPSAGPSVSTLGCHLYDEAMHAGQHELKKQVANQYGESILTMLIGEQQTALPLNGWSDQGWWA